MCTKNHNHMMYGFEIRSETDKKICHFGSFFALLPPPVMIQNIKILIKMRKMPWDIILLYIHVYHKWKSYFFFYNIINHKHILTKHYNHQEHTYCYLGCYKNTMLEQKLLEQITKIKILKEKRKIKG